MRGFTQAMGWALGIAVASVGISELIPGSYEEARAAAVAVAEADGLTSVQVDRMNLEFCVRGYYEFHLTGKGKETETMRVCATESGKTYRVEMP